MGETIRYWYSAKQDAMAGHNFVTLPVNGVPTRMKYTECASYRDYWPNWDDAEYLGSNIGYATVEVNRERDMGESDWESYFTKYSAFRWPEIAEIDSRTTNSRSLIEQAAVGLSERTTERQYKFVGEGLCSLCGIHANLIYAPSVSSPRSIWDFSSALDNHEKVCRTCFDMADAIKGNAYMVAGQRDFERERDHRRKLINGEL